MNDIKTSAVDHIFISHLHGDHFFGLIGLISTMNMQNRSQPLNVYGPMELKEIVDIQLKASLTELNFECNFIVTNPDEFCFYTIVDGTLDITTGKLMKIQVIDPDDDPHL